MKKKNGSPRLTANAAPVLSIRQAAERRAAAPTPENFDLTPVFEDPRRNTERRKRRSVFFANVDERRHYNRRNTCVLDTDWWISRRYAQQVETEEAGA